MTMEIALFSVHIKELHWISCSYTVSATLEVSEGFIESFFFTAFKNYELKAVPKITK